MKNEFSLRRDIVEIGRKMYHNRYIVAGDGNISVRLDDHILITPSGKNKGELKPEDLIVIDNSGKVIRGKNKPSSEYRMHVCVYQRRSDVNAILHAHPLYATTFAACGIELSEPILPEMIVFLKNVPLARYATPGTEEVCLSIENLSTAHEVILLANHGALCYSDSLDQAYQMLERLEHCSQIIYQGKLLKNLNKLSEEQIKALNI